MTTHTSCGILSSRCDMEEKVGVEISLEESLKNKLERVTYIKGRIDYILGKFAVIKTSFLTQAEIDVCLNFYGELKMMKNYLQTEGLDEELTDAEKRKFNALITEIKSLAVGKNAALDANEE